MYIITVIMLGAFMALAMTNFWYQVTSLYEVAHYLYTKEQRVQYLQGVLAYGIARYTSDEKIRKNVHALTQYEMACNSPFNFPNAESKIIYELLSPEELVIMATLSIRGTEETIRYSMPCQEKPF